MALNKLMPVGSNIDVDRYLARIHCKRQRLPSLKFLKQLHKNHLTHIPFENLDIHLGNEIILDVPKLYNKIVNNRRGGFCYELNGLFYQLLLSLGFQCHLISARTYDDDGSLSPEFDHAAVLVHLEDKVLLVDVGFGSLFLEPKLVQPGKVQMDYNQYFKIDKTIDGEYILSQSSDSFEYVQKYIFTKKERQFIEFIDMCRYHQTDKNSHFAKNNMITQVRPDGRITLTNSKLIISKAGNKTEQKILNHDEFCVKLYQHFRILYKRNN